MVERCKEDLGNHCTAELTTFVALLNLQHCTLEQHTRLCGLVVPPNKCNNSRTVLHGNVNKEYIL